MNTEEIIKKIPNIKIVPKTSKDQELIIARYNGSWEYYSPTKAEHYAAKKYFTSSNVLTLYADPIAYKEAVYFEYIPDINCVACVLCKIDTRIPLVNIKVDWIVENIFFITVEVSNSGNIEQVHGFGNRNADTEPGLEDFVKEWAKHNKLNVTNFNKVR